MPNGAGVENRNRAPKTQGKKFLTKCESCIVFDELKPLMCRCIGEFYGSTVAVKLCRGYRLIPANSNQHVG